jgi:hypothetical protein
MRKEEIGRARTVECGRTKKIRRSEIRKEERENRQRTEGGRLKTDGRRKTAALGRGTMDEGPEGGSQRTDERRRRTED